MNSIKELVKNNKKVSFTITVLVLILLWTITRPSSVDTSQIGSQIRSVQLTSIAMLAERESTIPLTGQVKSENETAIRSQASGEIVQNAIPRGSSVRAGDIIASIENASERASLTQALGTRSIAQAQLAKLKSGAQDEELSILKANTRTAESSLETSKTEIFTSVRNVYEVSEDIIRNNIDQMLINPRSKYPKTIFFVSNTQLGTKIEDARFFIEKMLKTKTISNWIPTVIIVPAPANLNAEIEQAKERLTATDSLLDNMIIAVNRLTETATLSQSTIEAWKGSLFGARTKLTSAVTKLDDSITALESPQNNLIIAIENEVLGVRGARSEDIAIAEASVLQAQGVYASARARFEKTLIRTPISGTLNSLSIELGDIVSNNDIVGIVSNNSTLEIVTYVTGDEVPNINVGNTVIISNVHIGSVTYIAPAIDRDTKKVEIRIDVPSYIKLLNGQSVSIEITRNPIQLDTIDDIRIPLSALKIAFDEHLVFTVDENNALIANKVTTGSLIGNDIIILEGISPTMNIVTDARGLKEGDIITILK
ncbi:hypothetical protein COB55_00785 [Candidatus Wolfebacteria bacterium]|nr:MAG: hypothetical protein COB55_00785 [Candidatus Wolfebacteria bacterium]